MESRRGTTIFPNTLPANVTYNDTHLTVKSINAYQSYTSYQYTLFLVITLDVSVLTDAQLHWLRESDMRVNAYLTSEANEDDFDSMPKLGSLLHADGKTLQVVLTSSFWDENRYDFSESEITLNIELKQEETYEYTGSDREVVDLNKTHSLHYTVTLPKRLPEAETISEPLYSYISDWLGDKADSLIP